METKSKFIQVKCKCGSEQVIFGSAASVVKCTNCDAILARPTGGKADIKTKITKVLE
jgi:small subunit ribosomal protein S27e|tara:strand:- start:2307 stop:2477 length:171 start_codon:yes stop_codon:yes gene_type:complete